MRVKPLNEVTNQADRCENGIVTWYCWNCIQLCEDEKGLAFCKNNPNAERTHRHYPSTILPIDEVVEE